MDAEAAASGLTTGPESDARAKQEQKAQEEEDLSARKMFELLRSDFANTASFAAYLLQDRSLQKDLRVIVDVLDPLHREYQEYLEVHKNGQHAVLQASAQRSLGKWFRTVTDTLSLLDSNNLLTRLELTPVTLGKRVMALGDKAAAEDVRVTRCLFDVTVELCANRMWSQAHHCLVFPYVFAAAAAESERASNKARCLLSNLAAAWLKLEDTAKESNKCAPLLEDLCTAQWQITREMLVVGTNCGWHLQNEQLQELCFACFAGPMSTKDILESTFAWLRDSMRQSKNSKLANWSQFCYLLSSPYARHDGGVAQHLPTSSDFTELLRGGFSDQEILDLNVWAPAKTGMSDEIPSPQNISKIRPAGFQANRVTSAASAYVLNQADRNFQQCDAAWAGPMLWLL